MVDNLLLVFHFPTDAAHSFVFVVEHCTSNTMVMDSIPVEQILLQANIAIA